MKFNQLCLLSIIAIQLLNVASSARTDNKFLSSNYSRDDGNCKLYTLDNLMKESKVKTPSKFESIARNVISKILGVIQKALPKVNACSGEFKGKNIAEKTGDTLCSLIPIDESQTVSLFGIKAENIKCPTNGVTFKTKFCIMGDSKSGTFGIATNTDLANCIADAIKPPNPISIPAFATKLLNIKANIAFAFSLNRALTVLNRSPNYTKKGLDIVDTNVKGHLYIHTTTKITTNLIRKVLDLIKGFFDIEKEKNLFELKGSISILADFGPSKVKDEVMSLFSGNNSLDQVLISLAESHEQAEFHIKSPVEIKMNLKNLTSGMIPDFRVHIDSNIIISLGRNNDGINRDAGIYFYNSVNMRSEFRDWLETLFDMYEDPFSKLGITIPVMEDMGNGKLEIGFAITAQKISFVIEVPSKIRISCTDYIRDRLECNKVIGPNGDGHFTVTYKGAEYYIQGIVAGIELGTDAVIRTVERLSNKFDQKMNKLSSKIHRAASKGISKISNIFDK